MWNSNYPNLLKMLTIRSKGFWRLASINKLTKKINQGHHKLKYLRDLITLHKLGRRWELHHEDLREENYEKLNDNFLPCNNQTHEMIHWLYRYYVNDPGIIDRLKAEMEKMKAINQGGGNDGVKI